MLIKNPVLKRFTFCSLITIAAVVGVGWFTGAKLVMHGALITVAVVAFLPLIVLTGLLFLPTLAFLSLGTFAMFFGEATLEIGAEAAWASRGIVPRYYRFMSRQKHPYFWGVPCGLVIGGVILAGMIAIWILPGETKTVEILAQTQAAIEQVYKEKGSFPKPDEDGHLSREALASGDDDPIDGVVLDGFGRPLRYEIKGRWKLASYELKSYGYDGRPGRDDFCVAGSSKLGKLASVTSSLLKIVSGEESGTLSNLRVKLEGIQSMRCEDE